MDTPTAYCTVRYRCFHPSNQRSLHLSAPQLFDGQKSCNEDQHKRSLLSFLTPLYSPSQKHKASENTRKNVLHVQSCGFLNPSCSSTRFLQPRTFHAFTKQHKNCFAGNNRSWKMEL
ncbi:hypothetical protein O6H91_10G059700 [Diphasiastrum complanatum]|uniref:Uncharacterized protein n=1 Tax=Diphasiastrum complanatum TaxID=34168 RepID=A0ACC2CHD3_DIPCM|nr:hypothetical protein O6H91_10G059700 [Diphasiastrum complanatum]